MGSQIDVRLGVEACCIEIHQIFMLLVLLAHHEKHHLLLFVVGRVVLHVSQKVLEAE
jgi:hypothetical protein